MPDRLAGMSMSCPAILLAAAFPPRGHAICLDAATNSLLAASQSSRLHMAHAAVSSATVCVPSAQQPDSCQPGQHVPGGLCHS